jgi:hypothetical protein
MTFGVGGWKKLNGTTGRHIPTNDNACIMTLRPADLCNRRPGVPPSVCLTTCSGACCRLLTRLLPHGAGFRVASMKNKIHSLVAAPRQRRVR